MDVREFLEKRKNGEIDIENFNRRLNKRTEKLKEYFITRVKPSETANKGLRGLPVSVKDNICTKGTETTAGSNILRGYRPVFSATSFSRLKNASLIGKTSMDEFGFGTFNTNCAYGTPRNPHDKRRVCGGSSGGSAGLTATLDLPHISLAESTGGSISCPASFCGVVGFTPTYGLVSRYGLVDYGNSLDKIGLMGRKIDDVKLGLDHIVGYDERDPTTLKKDYRNSSGEVKKIGIPKEYFEGVDDKVAKKVWESIKFLEKNGYEYREVSLPKTEQALPAYYIVAMAEASTNLAKFCGMRYGLHKKLRGNFNEYFSDVRTKGFGEEAKRRIIAGTFTRMAGYRDRYYLKALRVRTKIIEEFKSVFKEVDVLAAPSMPSIAPKFSEIEEMSPLDMYKMDKLTVPVNFAGMPHMSVPCGKAKGMPIGLHILGDHLNERKIFKVGKDVEMTHLRSNKKR